MCPNIHSYKKRILRICPGIPGTPHSRQSECDFVIVWRKKSGSAVYVHSLTRGRSFVSVSRNKYGGYSQAYAQFLPARKSFDEAQTDLNLFAQKKGWNIIHYV
jgi:hypothetical protein